MDYRDKGSWLGIGVVTIVAGAFLAAEVRWLGELVVTAGIVVSLIGIGVVSRIGGR